MNFGHANIQVSLPLRRVALQRYCLCTVTHPRQPIKYKSDKKVVLDATYARLKRMLREQPILWRGSCKPLPLGEAEDSR